MTTQGAYGFIINGVQKISYNGVDSYPTWLGSHIMKAVSEHGIAPFKEAVSMLEIVDGEDMPNEHQIKEYFHYSGRATGESISDWCDLLTNARGDITVYLEGVKQIIDAHEFLLDAVSCRWAYIINFDTGKFEIYFGGNNMNPKAAGRYAALQSDYNKKLGGGFNKVHGVVLVREVSLADIVKMGADDIVEYMSKLYEEMKGNSQPVGNAEEIIALYHKSK